MYQEAVEKAGYVLGKDVTLAMDCASSEFYNKETGKYEMKAKAVHSLLKSSHTILKIN